MAKKQNKKEKEPFLNIDGAEYSVDELNDNQKLMVQHLSDLNRKIDSANFNLQQLQFGRQAFVDALKASIDEAPDSEDKEQQLRKFQVIDSKVFSLYAEYGAVGIIVILFAMMIINLIKSQKMQNEDLDSIRQSIVKAETKVANVESKYSATIPDRPVAKSDILRILDFDNMIVCVLDGKTEQLF